MLEKQRRRSAAAGAQPAAESQGAPGPASEPADRPADGTADGPADGTGADARIDPAGGAATGPAHDERPGKPRPAWMGVLPELVALVLCVVLWTRTADLDTTVEGPGPAMFPRLLIALLAIAMVARVVQHARAVRKAVREGGPDARPPRVTEGEIDEQALSMPRVWQAIGLSVGYVVATIYIGWIIGTFAFLVTFLYMCGKRRLYVTVPASAATAVALAYVFVKVVYIALPTGVGVFDVLTVRLLQALGAF